MLLYTCTNTVYSKLFRNEKKSILKKPVTKGLIEKINVDKKYNNQDDSEIKNYLKFTKIRYIAPGKSSFSNGFSKFQMSSRKIAVDRVEISYTYFLAYYYLC